MRPGLNLLKGRHAHQDEQQQQHGGLPATDSPGDRRRGGNGRQQPQQRPDDPHQEFGLSGIDDEVESREQAGEPGIDQARPVRVVYREADRDATDAGRTNLDRRGNRASRPAARRRPVSCSVRAAVVQFRPTSWRETASQHKARRIAKGYPVRPRFGWDSHAVRSPVGKAAHGRRAAGRSRPQSAKNGGTGRSAAERTRFCKHWDRSVEHSLTLPLPSCRPALRVSSSLRKCCQGWPCARGADRSRQPGLERHGMDRRDTRDSASPACPG